MATSSEIWIDRSANLTRVALIKGKTLVALEVDRAGCAPRLGARYVAKVLRLNTALKAAELDLGAGQVAFLSSTKVRIGELVLVEWVAPALGAKQAIVKLCDGEASGVPRLLEDGPEALARLQAYAPQDCCLREESGLFEQLDINARIDDLSKRAVFFKGGSLVIDQTEAATVIDINGTLPAPELNRNALQAIARQIRLRNLSGIILVDLVSRPDRGLCPLLRDLTADDPCQVDVYGISKLGILELTRERRGWPLSALLTASSAHT